MPHDRRRSPRYAIGRGARTPAATAASSTLKLLLERQRVAMDHPHAGSAHKQLAAIAELDRPGFLRGAAGELAQVDDVSA